MTRHKSKRHAAPPPSSRVPRWALWAIVAVVIAAAYGGYALLQSHQLATLRASVPDPDLTQVEPRVTAAIEVSRERVRAAPDSADAWGALGGTFDAHGLYDAAEPCYIAARRLAPDDFRWAYLLAIVRDVNGADAEEVERRFREATALRDDYAPAWFRLGHALSLRGRQVEAREAFERAIAVEPDLAPAHRERGQVLLALGDDEAALAALRRAAELMPTDAGVWSALAQALTRVGQADAARVAAARAQRMRPANVLRDPIHGRLVASRGRSTVQLLERAGAQIGAGDFSGALDTARVVLADRPDDAQTHYLAGTACARLGRVDDARGHFDSALATDPAHVGALLESGALLEAENRTWEAREFYVRAREAEPRDPQVLASLARASAQSDDDWMAAQAFEQLAEVTRLDARTLMNWGNSLTRLDRTAEAVARYEAALELQPDYAHVHFNLALALEELGRRDDAIRHYREARRLDATLPAAQALARLGVPR